MELSDRIRKLVEAGDYVDALRLGTPASGGRIHDPEVLKSMFGLTAELRSVCMDLASKKQDSGPEYFALEDLLHKANDLTGEDMYGRIG